MRKRVAVMGAGISGRHSLNRNWRGKWNRWLRRSKKRMRLRMGILYYVLRSGHIPLKTKLLGSLALGYFLSPIDLIPDFIPILGQLDDAIILPLLIAFTLRSVPKELVRDCARKAIREPVSLSKNWRAGAVVVLIWIFVLALLGCWIIKCMHA
ncbi:MAG: YkvA family protein [Spirochaetia bacterium]|nr:YkvA family protein [Spirochaetia bacterium]